MKNKDKSSSSESPKSSSSEAIKASVAVQKSKVSKAEQFRRKSMDVPMAILREPSSSLTVRMSMKPWLMTK